MKTWDVVRTAWKIVLDHRAVLGMLIGVQLVLGFLGLPFQDQQQIGPGLGVLGFLLMLAQFFLLPLLQGGSLALSNAALAQSPVPSAMALFWRAGRAVYTRMLGFEFVMVGIGFALVLLGLILSLIVGLVASQVTWLAIPLIIVALVPFGIGLYIVIVLVAMAPTAIVVDQLKVFAAIKRGWAVGRRAIFKLILVSLALLVTLLPAVLMLFVLGMLGGQQNPGINVVALIIQGIASGLSWFLFSVANVMIYRHAAAKVPAPS